MNIIIKQHQRRQSKKSVADFALKQFKAKLRTNKTGDLYHTTSAIAVISMIKNGKGLQTANNLHEGDDSVWWKDESFDTPQPHYGDFIYTHQNTNSTHYGVSSQMLQLNSI